MEQAARGTRGFVPGGSKYTHRGHWATGITRVRTKLEVGRSAAILCESLKQGTGQHGSMWRHSVGRWEGVASFACTRYLLFLKPTFPRATCVRCCTAWRCCELSISCHVVWFKVLTEVSMKMAVFWFVAPISLVEVYRRFRGTSLPTSSGDGATTQKTAIFWSLYRTTAAFHRAKDDVSHAHKKTSKISIGLCEYFALRLTWSLVFRRSLHRIGERKAWSWRVRTQVLDRFLWNLVSGVLH
jgi:hypothetical protein